MGTRGHVLSTQCPENISPLAETPTPSLAVAFDNMRNADAVPFETHYTIGYFQVGIYR
jgi:hypothetical protein